MGCLLRDRYFVASSVAAQGGRGVGDQHGGTLLPESTQYLDSVLPYFLKGGFYIQVSSVPRFDGILAGGF